MYCILFEVNPAGRKVDVSILKYRIMRLTKSLVTPVPLCHRSRSEEAEFFEADVTKFDRRK